MLARASTRAAIRSSVASRSASKLASFATLDPKTLGEEGNVYSVNNLVSGEWRATSEYMDVVDPLKGGVMCRVAKTEGSEADEFVQNLRAVPKSGMHNPLKNVERYLAYGDVTARAAEMLLDPEVEDFFARLIQRTSPKSYAQAVGEIKITRQFLHNFCGDQVRFLARGFTVPGDHLGQQSAGYRWPFGPVGLITPFNFPIEIPILQLMGCLYMGNRPLLHVDPRVTVATEQFVRMLIACGMPATDVDFINGRGPVVGDILKRGHARNTLFTGSNGVAEHLTRELGGRVRVEDAGFDWKILGPDVADADYVAWQCDQDAYACSGQKCSAQSLLFMHDNWAKMGMEAKLAERAAMRSLEDLTIGPVLTWSTRAILDHVENLTAIPGARVAFGAKELEGHSIPEQYGAVEPTAVFVPLREILKEEHFGTVTTEVFGPLQVITSYTDEELPLVLEACERMENHLTAAVVSKDTTFLNHVLGNTCNGTTYSGVRARTTGAPQNHWFGPAGDPRGAGIGTPEAIHVTWSTHREIITDAGPVPAETPSKPT